MLDITIIPTYTYITKCKSNNFLLSIFKLLKVHILVSGRTETEAMYVLFMNLFLNAITQAIEKKSLHIEYVAKFTELFYNILIQEYKFRRIYFNDLLKKEYHIEKLREIYTNQIYKIIYLPINIELLYVQLFNRPFLEKQMYDIFQTKVMEELMQKVWHPTNFYRWKYYDDICLQFIS